MLKHKILIGAVSLLCLILISNPVGAQVSAIAKPESRLPQSAAEIKLSYAPLVKRVSPAVVNIITRVKTREVMASPLMIDPFFRQFFDNGMFPGVPREREKTALGSGVIVESSGLLVTSNHVVRDADQITIILADRREFPAKVVLRDEKTDLAVLRMEGAKEKFQTLALGNSDSLEVGDIVLAIGNPFGVGQTVTSGIVSGLARTTVGISDYSFFIQTDAAINPGNSGGALVGMDGKLVGINTAIYSKSGGSNGIGFAIPANMVQTVLSTIDRGGKKVVRPWFGVEGQNITADLAQSLGLSRPTGVLVKSVHPLAPMGSLVNEDNTAISDRIKPGDVILDINGIEVVDAESLKFRIATLPIGQEIDMTVMRGGKTYPYKTKLMAPPNGADANGENELRIGGTGPLAGTVLAPMSPALAEEFGFEDINQGIVIKDIDAQRSARGLNLMRGDIILKINRQDIQNLDQVRKIIDSKAKIVDIILQRGNQVVRWVFR